MKIEEKIFNENLETIGSIKRENLQSSTLLFLKDSKERNKTVGTHSTQLNSSFLLPEMEDQDVGLDSIKEDTKVKTESWRKKDQEVTNDKLFSLLVYEVINELN